jgi:hypothetical protein
LICFEDLEAVAEDLIAKKVTSPAKLAIRGGSNGGLLVGAAFTRRPDLYKAVVCMVPLLDMRRYNKLLAGASWMAEYGNPDVPGDWAFLKTYSPYHNVFKDKQYPRVLFTTSTRDDRAQSVERGLLGIGVERPGREPAPGAQHAERVLLRPREPRDVVQRHQPVVVGGDEQILDPGRRRPQVDLVRIDQIPQPRLGLALPAALLAPELEHRGVGLGPPALEDPREHEQTIGERDVEHPPERLEVPTTPRDREGAQRGGPPKPDRRLAK